MSTIESDLPVVVQEHSNSQTPSKFQEQVYKFPARDIKGGGDTPEFLQNVQESSLRKQNAEEHNAWKKAASWLPDLKITEPTKEQRDDAEKQFDKGVSSLLSDADQKTLKTIGHAILEGDSKALAAALAGIHDPERLKAFVKETNHIMNALGSSAELAIGPNGNVLEYSKEGNVAIEIDPSKGQVVGERPIEVHGGKVVLKDGTILNGDVDVDAKNIGNSAIGDIENPYYKILTEEQETRPYIGWPHEHFPHLKFPKIYDQGIVPFGTTLDSDVQRKMMLL